MITTQNNPVYQYMIKCLKEVLLQQKVSAPVGDFDWEDLYHLSQFHNIANILAAGFTKANISVPVSVKQQFEVEFQKAIFLEAIRQQEMILLEDCLQKSEIRFVRLKGLVVKHLYPELGMRTMCDLDYMIDKYNMKKACQSMQSVGWQLFNRSAHHDVFKNNSPVTVEIHCMSSSNLLKNVMDDVNPNPDNKFLYEMTPENFYLYLITHLKHHFVAGGIGIRPFMDVFLWKKKYGSEWNQSYLTDEWSRMKLADFVNNVEILADFWFGDGPPNDTTKFMEDYILKSGIRGTTKQISITKISNYVNSKKVSFIGKLLLFIRRVFPSLSEMTGIYPWLKYSSLLLPIAWFHRIINLFSTLGWSYIKNKIKYMFYASQEEIDQHKIFMKKIGLDNTNDGENQDLDDD